MPDFSRPEYVSYVQLCRELRMKRPLDEMPKPFESTQQFEGWDQIESGGLAYSYGLAQDFSPFVVKEGADPIWLPTLADWLEMLEKVVVYHIAIAEVGRAENGDKGYVITDLGSDGGWSYDTFGPSNPAYPTREEAAGRLWMAVTQTPAAPSPPSAAR